MARALDVAKYLIHLAQHTGDEGDTLSHLRLQKLLYYVQGWHLGATGKPLFPEVIEAWKFGPVVGCLYPTFKEYKLTIDPDVGADSDAIIEHDKEFVRSIWDRYKGFSAIGLTNMTHRESPWVDAYARRDRNDQFDNPEIAPHAMRTFFLPRYVELLKQHDSRIVPERWLAASDAVAAGRVRTAKDIRRELRNRRAGADPV